MGKAWQRDLVTMAEAYSCFAWVQGIHAGTNGRNHFKRPTTNPILIASPSYKRWLIETSYSTLLGVLIRTTFTDSRKFPMHNVSTPHPKCLPPFQLFLPALSPNCENKCVSDSCACFWESSSCWVAVLNLDVIVLTSSSYASFCCIWLLSPKPLLF